MKIKQKIDALKKISLAKIDTIYIREKTNYLFKDFIHTGVVIPEKWGRLHRSIKYESIPDNIAKLGCPPSDKVKLGRANFEGLPVFYCSGDPRTTFFELDIKEKDTVVLSKWNIIKELVIFPIGYTSEIFAELNSARGCPIIVPEQNKDPRENNLPNTQIRKFFTQEFMRVVRSGQKYLYKLSAAIAENFFICTDACGIVYPTIAMNANAENFAINPCFVQSHLKLQSANWYRIDNINKKNLEYTVTSLAYADSFGINGEIEWRKTSEEEAKFL